MKVTARELERLLAAASDARRNAHAPYSKFRVGAAVLGRSGRIFTGVNVENASYGLTICAERVAVGNAVTAGEKELVAVAIVAPGAAAPCGACRQVSAEFGIEMVASAATGRLHKAQVWLLSELLPVAFQFTSPKRRG